MREIIFFILGIALGIQVILLCINHEMIDGVYTKEYLLKNGNAIYVNGEFTICNVKE